MARKTSDKPQRSKREVDREALRDLTEEQLFDEIGRLPEYIREMKELRKENRKLQTAMRNGKRILQVKIDRINELEVEIRKRDRLSKPSDVPVPLPPPAVGGEDFGPAAGIEGEPFSCRSCAAKIMFIVTAKNRKKATVDAHGVKGKKISHRMRDALASAWGFDAKGVYTTVQTDAEPDQKDTTIYEYHNCRR